MAKFSGLIGYIETQEVEPGVWEEVITERKHTGDLLKIYGKHEASGNINDNINIANEISIISDPYATEHFFAIRYVKFSIPKLGGVWKITGVEVEYPRLKLTLGGVYNG